MFELIYQICDQIMIEYYVKAGKFNFYRSLLRQGNGSIVGVPPPS